MCCLCDLLLIVVCGCCYGGMLGLLLDCFLCFVGFVLLRCGYCVSLLLIVLDLLFGVVCLGLLWLLYSIVQFCVWVLRMVC